MIFPLNCGNVLLPVSGTERRIVRNRTLMFVFEHPRRTNAEGFLPRTLISLRQYRHFSEFFYILSLSIPIRTIGTIFPIHSPYGYYRSFRAHR